MGSAFIGYGIILTILLLVGKAWLARTGRSQEFFDSLIIAAWGCVNTFTEHRWGTAWVKNDLQHTSMGIVWWCAGLLGAWLSRRRDGRPKRNLIPAVVIVLTGWAMSAHPQGLELSTHVHTVFGWTLMAAGAARIVEIAFVLKDRNGLSDTDMEEVNSWQYLTPFVRSRSPIPLSSHPSLNLGNANIFEKPLAPLHLRLPLHGRHRTANGPALRRPRLPCLVHPPPLQHLFPTLPLRVYAAASLRLACLAPGIKNQSCEPC